MKLAVVMNERYEVDNAQSDATAAALASKIFELVISTNSVGEGARALDFAIRGLSKLDRFGECFEWSKQITSDGVAIGMLKFEITP